MQFTLLLPTYSFTAFSGVSNLTRLFTVLVWMYVFLLANKKKSHINNTVRGLDRKARGTLTTAHKTKIKHNSQ